MLCNYPGIVMLKYPSDNVHQLQNIDIQLLLNNINEFVRNNVSEYSKHTTGISFLISLESNNIEGNRSNFMIKIYSE